MENGTSDKALFPPGAVRNGIEMSFDSGSGLVHIGGWYGDDGIEPTCINLCELFARLGILRSDCTRAFDDIPLTTTEGE